MDDSGEAESDGEPTDLACQENAHVQSNTCVPCPPGTVNEAGDAASGVDTFCDPVICEENEFVQDNACYVCPAGGKNDAGDDASGPDTVCVDSCESALGVTCDEYEEAYLKASNTGADDRFGIAISLSGDTLVVGAYGEQSNTTGVDGGQADDSAAQSGAVYVFRRSGSIWTQEAYLKASNTDEGDQFGWSLSLSGDVLVVGAPGEDSNSTGLEGDQDDDSSPDSGAVYVFQRTGTSWSQAAYLKASNSEEGDEFGWSVAVSGDTLAVGSREEDSGATGLNGEQDDASASSSGAVYVFRQTEDIWAQEAYLKASNTDAFDRFGGAVALMGDTLVVGAEGERSSATGVNGDQADDSASTSGAVYVFTRTANLWSQQAYLKASNTAPSSRFGGSLALSENTLAVGASGEDNNATGVDGIPKKEGSIGDSGAVYVFQRTGSVWAQEVYIKASNAGLDHEFGESVALSGDTLVVGAHQERSTATGVNGSQTIDSASRAGAVYLFRRTKGTWDQRAYLKASNTGAGDRFGASVALLGDTLAVGAPREDSSATGSNGNQLNNSAPDSGAVYVRRISP